MKYLPWLWPALALMIGVIGMSTAWMVLAILSKSLCSWLALVAAANMALLLRWTGVSASATRVLLAVLTTAITIILSHWLIVATQLGFVFAIDPLPSVLRLGPVLAWEITRLSLVHADWVLLALSLPLAACLAIWAKPQIKPN